MNPASSKISPLNAWFAIILLTATVAGGAALIYFFNPTAYPIYPVCQFHQLTGLNCPGCGATRALYALLHGNFPSALRDNALLVVGLPAALLRGGWFAFNHWRGRPNGSFLPGRWLLSLLVVMVVFGVLRNLPAFAFLSP